MNAAGPPVAHRHPGRPSRRADARLGLLRWAGYVIPLPVLRARPAYNAVHPDPERLPLVRMLRSINVCFARIYHQLQVCSPCPLPRRGPAILVCNHTSGLDPALIQSACHRGIIWMMAREYYDHPSIHWFFKAVHAIPVDRGGRDLAATRQALRTLEAGHVLGVFPEGRIETDHELLPFQTGVAMMAMKTRVPVYPAWLDGTQRGGRSMLRTCLERQSASIEFGPQINLEPYRTPRPQLESATARIEQEVLALRQHLDCQPLENGPGIFRAKWEK